MKRLAYFIAMWLLMIIGGFVGTLAAQSTPLFLESARAPTLNGVIWGILFLVICFVAAVCAERSCRHA